MGCSSDIVVNKCLCRSLLLVSCTSGGLVQSHRQPEQSGSTDRWHLESSWQGPSNVQATVSLLPIFWKKLAVHEQGL